MQSNKWRKKDEIFLFIIISWQIIENNDRCQAKTDGLQGDINHNHGSAGGFAVGGKPVIHRSFFAGLVEWKAVF